MPAPTATARGALRWARCESAAPAGPAATRSPSAPVRQCPAAGAAHRRPVGAPPGGCHGRPPLVRPADLTAPAEHHDLAASRL